MKNYLLGILFLLAAIFLSWQQSEVQKEKMKEEESKKYNPLQEDLDSHSPEFQKVDASSDLNQRDVNDSSTYSFPTLKVQSEEKLFEGLKNEFSTLQFSNHTGAIREIKLNRHGRLNREFSMPQNKKPFLALSFEDENGNLLKEAMPDPRGFRKLSDEPNRVVYVWESNQNLRIERVYLRDENSTYAFKHKIKMTNLSSERRGFERVRLQLGSSFQIPRLYNPFDQTSTYLNVGYYNAGPALPEGCSCATCSGRIDGEKEEFIQANEMNQRGRMETRYLSQARWACVNNQFFVHLVRPIQDMANVRISGGNIQAIDPETGNDRQGVEGTMSFPLGSMESGTTKTFEFEIYAGPKDYNDLKNLGSEQKKIMQFGVFWWISEPLSWLLNAMSGLVGSYGLGIILLTVIVKIILWPLTAKATRSQKKMQALQGPMAKLREKHKGNSNKLNQEMMKFYKEHKVNPFAGCWPIMIQIPIFLGMFWMLRSASELYGQSFLWANDLSEQDNVTVIQGFSVNLLPILMVATQWFQMKLNPIQMGPEMSEAQRINVKMMRFMPFMFLVFLYFFSSALVLYWTIQNLMTIFQTLITKKETLGGSTQDKIPSADDSLPRNGVREKTTRELSDDERKNRNLLGLRFKGKLNIKEIESKYKERAGNYSEKKLTEMNASKRRQAIAKKERLERAYRYLKEQVKKDS